MSDHLVTIAAGAHYRRCCPLEFVLPAPVSSESLELLGEEGERIPLQHVKHGAVRGVLPELPEGQSRTYRVTQSEQKVSEPIITMSDREGGIDVLLHGDLLTRYFYSDVPARPYFYPVNGPGGVPVTRSYPMSEDVPGETHDHPHHRSLWIAHGDVNGADNWSESDGHARTVHEAITELSGGPVFGSFSTHGLWKLPDNTPLLMQRLKVTAWATTDEYRILDFAIDLDSDFGAVHFGDTKEGGILSVRVASELDVVRTGRITNVYGGVDENETWGKASHWCDYSGTVGGSAIGIAVMDHPHSERYPTHWHVRNYGLMTANPFGYAAYTKGIRDGSYTLSSGKSLSFRYRVVLHRGSCAEAQINSRYLDFVSPPRVTITN